GRPDTGTMNPLLALSLVGLLAAGFWFVCRPRCAFVVRVADGTARVAAGKVTPAFLQEVSEACAGHGVRRGTVRGLVRGRRIALAFAGGIPRPCRQQLRNLWALSGWPAAPKEPRERRPA